MAETDHDERGAQTASGDRAEPAGPDTADAGRPDPAADWSSRHVLSYMVGCFVSVNAIRDAFLLVDGPDCIYQKTQFIQGNQDYQASLISVGGYHKVSHTALKCASNVASPREAELRQTLERIGRQPEVGCVLLTSMPAATILGIDYERLCQEAEAASGTPTLVVPGRSLSSDWLGAYDECLRSLAKGYALEKPAPRDEDVAIVGYLFDRNEEDNRGNIRELERLLSGLGLNLVSVWLDGGDYAGLDRIHTASTILSFPHGRRAARTIAKRLDARLLETELPFGLPATERWVRQLGEAFGRQDRAEALIDRELHRIVPKLEWVVPFLFQGRRFGYAGEPNLLPGFLDTIELLGGSVRFAIVTNAAQHMEGIDVGGRVEHVLVGERLHTVNDWLRDHLTRNEIDCVVTNNSCLDFLVPTRHAVVEFGFPSYAMHALYDRPYLGFSGFLAFVDTLANQIRLFGALRKRLTR